MTSASKSADFALFANNPLLKAFLLATVLKFVTPTMSSEEQQSTPVEASTTPERDESPVTSSDESGSRSPSDPSSPTPPSTENPSSVPAPDSSSQDQLKAKKEERMKKLRELKLRRNEARKLNHVEVVEEDKRNKLPTNWESRKRKAEWELAEEEAKKKAEEAGEDYERVKMLDISAADLDRKERKLRRKKNPDPGFSDFAQLQHRQYERVVKEMEPDMVAYEKQKAKLGADFYPTVNTLIHGSEGSASAAGIDRMVADLEKQIDKRGKYSRKRAKAANADVDYINDKNMRFNKKVARFYDKYTTEIKQNLERGTAI